MALCWVGILGAAAPAGAAERCPPEQLECGEETPGWDFLLEAILELPLDLGARLRAEGPYRIRIDTSLGWLPGAFVGLTNAILTAAGAYDEETAELIEGALSSSLVWRTHVGWRPVADCGFGFAVGYGLVALGGDLRAGELIAAVTGREPPPGSSVRYEVRSMLHQVDVELDWTWLLVDERLSLRAAVGLAATVAASTEVLPGVPDDITSDAADYLDEIYTSYVFVPVLTFGIGYRF